MPHTLREHVGASAPSDAFDDVVRSRKDGAVRNSMYYGPPEHGDDLVARTLDYRHEAIQRWVQELRDEDAAPGVTEPFTMPVDDPVGRGYDPKLQADRMFDTRTVRVVLRSTAAYPYYEVYTSYPTK